METGQFHLHGCDQQWVGSSTREELLAGLEQAGQIQRQVDLASTQIRAELARRREPGCGHDAADETAAETAAGVSRRTGRRDERRAKIAADVSAAGTALAGGAISAEHLDAVASVVPDDVFDAVIEHQHDLFDRASTMSPDRFRRDLVGFVREIQRERNIDRPARQRIARKGRCHTVGRTGMIELHAELDPLAGAHVTTRVRTEYKRLFGLDQQANNDAKDAHHEADIDRSVEQRWADAIVNVICAGGRGPVDDRLPVVVVERAVLEERTETGRCEIAGADDISADTGRYMSCDRPVLALNLDPNGKPVALTGFHRHANAAQRRALNAIWGTCVGPDCDVAFPDCHIHHTVPWSTRPVTSLQELAPLCSRHHHLAHEGGWTLRHLGDHTIEWTDTGGNAWSRKPNPPPDTS